MIEESIALANVIPDKAAIVMLDERGESLDSAALATQLGRWRDDGRPAAVFIIGGDDGLAPSLRDKATLRLAFGAATWPHQLVRVHAAGADLPRGHHPGRASLPPRLMLLSPGAAALPRTAMSAF